METVHTQMHFRKKEAKKECIHAHLLFNVRYMYFTVGYSYLSRKYSQKNLTAERKRVSYPIKLHY